MKKIIALVLAVVMVCCFSVTAFAAESPTATEKATITVRKADVVEPAGKVVDTEYTIEVGTIITVKANSKYGTFDGWSIYKEEAKVQGVSAPVNSGIITLSAVKALAATTKMVDAAAGTDYEIVKGDLKATELTIKVNKSIVICANYSGVKTDPTAVSNADASPSAPQTNDMVAVYALVVMMAAVAFGFGVKKVYSK